MVNILKASERQLRSLRSDPEGRRRCEHSLTEISRVSGIERVVCQGCGDVSIRAVAESVTKRAAGSGS